MAKSSFALLALAATTAHGAGEKGMGSSFLQSSGAQVLKKAVQGKHNMNDGDRSDLLSFLSDGAYSEYAPADTAGFEKGI